MKPLIHVPIKKQVFVPTASGNAWVILDRFGQCRSCEARVYHARSARDKQWVPVVEIQQDEQYELHQCPVELKRNQALRELVYGQKEEPGKQD